MEKLNYYNTFDRKMREVLEELERDPRKALRNLEKEIDKKGKKIESIFMLNFRTVRGICLDKNNRLEEAREEIQSVISEIKRDNLTDSYLLETL